MSPKYRQKSKLSQKYELAEGVEAKLTITAIRELSTSGQVCGMGLARRYCVSKSYAKCVMLKCCTVAAVDPGLGFSGS